MQAMANKEVCFGIGPAGTGKTYLAVASAVNALETNSVRRFALSDLQLRQEKDLDFYQEI